MALDRFKIVGMTKHKGPDDDVYKVDLMVNVWDDTDPETHLLQVGVSRETYLAVRSIRLDNGNRDPDGQRKAFKRSIKEYVEAAHITWLNEKTAPPDPSKEFLDESAVDLEYGADV